MRVRIKREIQRESGGGAREKQRTCLRERGFWERKSRLVHDVVPGLDPPLRRSKEPSRTPEGCILLLLLLGAGVTEEEEEEEGEGKEEGELGASGTYL